MNHETFNRWMNWKPRIEKISGKWFLWDFDGHPFPTTFKTKAAAMEVAERHRASVKESKPWCCDE